jgi:hypothetical protein
MIGPIATTVTAVSEVVVYYPGTTIQIVPQQMQIESGQLTIWIPRCRLVKLGLQNGPVAYETLSNFVDAVDVVRIYNDPTVQATLIWPHAHSQRCAETGCTENTQTACLYVLDGDIGNVTVRPATHVDGVWTTASPAYPGRPYKVRLNYRAGVGTIQPALKEALVRLAHVLMPTEPCSCDVVQRLWKRDRNMPPMFDRERLNCPFGTSDGAWFAWRVVQARRVVTMGDVLMIYWIHFLTVLQHKWFVIVAGGARGRHPVLASALPRYEQVFSRRVWAICPQVFSRQHARDRGCFWAGVAAP